MMGDAGHGLLTVFPLLYGACFVFPLWQAFRVMGRATGPCLPPTAARRRTTAPAGSPSILKLARWGRASSPAKTCSPSDLMATQPPLSRLV
jgi:hypothetical protein